MRNIPRILLEKINKPFDFMAQLLLLLTLIIAFVPFSPKMPAPGIDPSWALGLNQAVAQGLAFGKEIIFTLGPYSSLYTKAYHPATDLMMIAGCLYLAFTYWGCLLFLMKKNRWYWTLIYCVPFLGMIYSRDSLFFSYPLLAGLCSLKINSLEHKITGNYLLLFAFFLFAPLGLLALIKGSMLIICLLMLLLCFIFFLANKEKNLALICLVSPSISIILFWLAAGQSLLTLPGYLTNSLFIASGFTEAMSSDGNMKEVILYLLTCSLIFLTIFLNKQIPATLKIFLLGVYFIFLFVSFKTGFTRHLGHAFIPGTSVLLATLFLPYIINSWTSYLLIVVTLNTWFSINSQYTNISIRDNFISTYSSAWHGFKNRIQDSSWLEKNYTLTMSFIRDQAAFPILKGTTDIYSYDQAYLISSHNTWAPRPIFQSYSAFNPGLAANNRKHLQGKHKPDNIIFKIEPIDQRVPSLEDGASWPLLLANYQPIHSTNNFLFLKRKKHEHPINITLLKRESHSLGEPVEIPETQLLFAEIEITPTILGSLATIVFKPQQLHITMNLNNGTTKKYHLVTNMAKSTFLLSPLIESTVEFSLLYKNNHELDAKKVKSLVITTNQRKNWHWNNEYTINFKHATD
ncbi:hypothetical protein DGG96_14805 [Legionella qingyii]|uniref:Transmembrane protein n=2 Tax=Legionella qingyii TaxID=2184757 RepID=A0A317U0Z3_9GAMM|nr:hypothetical protein [Legionella qingyii]PWY54885.1 hypothetical protein DGG96_14805 [Legionella qingyii]RUR20912.1 hypothetical protein ELY20_13985 [Legionella qingyii]